MCTDPRISARIANTTIPPGAKVSIGELFLSPHLVHNYMAPELDSDQVEHADGTGNSHAARNSPSRADTTVPAEGSTVSSPLSASELSAMFARRSAWAVLHSAAQAELRLSVQVRSCTVNSPSVHLSLSICIFTHTYIYTYMDR